MTARAGRKAVIYWREVGDTEWLLPTGVKEKSLTINNAPIDITSDDDDGWKTSLDEFSGMRDWSLKVGGVLKDNPLVSRAVQETSIEVLYVIPTIFHITGKARITSCEVPAAGEDPVTYDVSFEGSGEPTIGNGTVPA